MMSQDEKNQPPQPRPQLQASKYTVVSSHIHGSNSAPSLNKVGLDDFHFECVLGRGAFGKVLLAKEKRTNNYYAIKALKKDYILERGDVHSAKLEKRVLQLASKARHPFMLNIHSAFQTSSRIYFVMEYANGGELLTLLQNVGQFSQLRTKFYACEILLALEYLHSQNIIYRYVIT
jgi:serine/threonine protein kinase